MAAKDPKEMFVLMLSDLRRGTEQATGLFQELSEIAETREVKEILQARVFVSDRILGMLDRCFQIIGEKPIRTNGPLQDIFLEDFRRQLAEIQNPVARRLFILARVNHLIHFRMAEYATLIATADVLGHYAVGVILESCLADKRAFAERTQRLIRTVVDPKIAEGQAA